MSYANNPARWIGEILYIFDQWEREFMAKPGHSLTGREQLNVGIVEGGDYINRLPTPISIVGIHRWPPGLNWLNVRKRYEDLRLDLQERSGLDVEVSFTGQRDPFQTPLDDPVIEALESGGHHVRGVRPEVIGMALVGDANLFANDIPLPTVYFGPGHRTAHSDHERIAIEDLVETAQLYAQAAVKYCGLVGT